MGKAQVRSAMLARLRSLGSAERERLERLVMGNLLPIQEMKDAENVFCYVSLDYEVGTHRMIKELLGAGKRVFAPVTDTGKRTLHVSQILGMGKGMKQGPYGIPEPKGRRLKELDPIDVWIVPGLAFDSRGYRIGHGAGYFDSFFAQNPVRGKRIGLAFSFQLVGKVPDTRRDVPVDMVVTEKGVINCLGNR